MSYTYDQNGNQTAAGGRTFIYDLSNRVGSTTNAGTTTTFGYDGDGNRTQATTSSATTTYRWDIGGSLPELALEESSVTSRRYIYGRDRLSVVSGATVSYLHRDAIGSVSNITSTTGGREWTYAYEPYGAIRSEIQEDSSAVDNSFRFAGELLDPAGLYYLHAREYDPVTSRFLQRDPASARHGTPSIGAYVYAGDRPTVFVDPSGRTFERPDDGQETAEMASSSARIAPTSVGRRRCRIIPAWLGGRLTVVCSSSNQEEPEELPEEEQDDRPSCVVFPFGITHIGEHAPRTFMAMAEITCIRTNELEARIKLLRSWSRTFRAESHLILSITVRHSHSRYAEATVSGTAKGPHGEIDVFATTGYDSHTGEQIPPLPSA